MKLGIIKIIILFVLLSAIYVISINIFASNSDNIIEEYSNYKKQKEPQNCSYSTDGGLNNITISCDTNFTKLEKELREKFDNSSINRGRTIKVKMGISDHATASVYGTRWYGEIMDDGTNRNAYIFSFIKLPIENKNFDFRIAHIVFPSIMLFILVCIIIVKFINSKELEGEENVD